MYWNELANFELHCVQIMYINIHPNRTKKCGKRGGGIIYDLQTNNEFHSTEFYEIQEDRSTVL